MPKILDISNRKIGLAGQYAYVVKLQYPDSMPESTIFVHTNGQIFLVLESGRQIRVDNPTRFGIPLSPTWIRRFYK